MANVSVQHLRNDNPSISPTDLLPGQIAFNNGVAPDSSGLQDTYMFIGNGSNTRIDSEGNDLSGTVSGTPTNGLGWVRHSLQTYIIDAGEF